jgi:hypothetical protein
MLAGTQGGKTSFIPWWLYREIQRCGEGDYLAATASYDLFKLKFLPEMRTVFEETLGIGRWWASSRVMELADETGRFWAKNSDDKMWGRIILRSAQSPAGFESASANAAAIDEAGMDDFTLAHWEAILRRLSLSEGRVFLGTTLYNLGWLKSELFDPWTEGDPDIDIIQFPSTLNPLFPVEEFERARDHMQAWRFDMFYLGKYAIPPSLIYGKWALEDPIEVHRTWPIVVGVDPSGGHCATVWVAQNPQGKWHCFRETFSVGATTAQNVADARREAVGFRDIAFVGGGPSETQERRDWQDHGIDLSAPQVTSVEAGIDRTSALLGSGRMKVSKECRGLRDELGKYRRKVDDVGNVLPQILDTEYGPSPTAGYRG